MDTGMANGMLHQFLYIYQIDRILKRTHHKLNHLKLILSRSLEEEENIIFIATEICQSCRYKHWKQQSAA